MLNNFSIISVYYINFQIFILHNIYVFPFFLFKWAEIWTFIVWGLVFNLFLLFSDTLQTNEIGKAQDTILSNFRI